MVITDLHSMVCQRPTVAGRHEREAASARSVDFAVSCSCMFCQLVLGRHFVVEQPHGSDLFEAKGINMIIGKDNLLNTFTWIFDQCMLGANSDGVATKKKTEMRSNKAFTTQPLRCD